MQYRYKYGLSGRLIETYLTINSEEEILVSQMEYNAIGELSAKNLYSEENISFLQAIDYKYNLRGWLTQINDPFDLDTETDAFGMQLIYNTANEDVANTPLFNGNITAAIWNTATNNFVQSYSYAYDKLNRITDADYSFSLNDTWNATEINGVNSIDYDYNGNIKALNRYDDQGALLDELTYTYDGNKLLEVEDGGSDGGFFEDATPGTKYSYDRNGNLKADLNKGIGNIAYNYLNLPMLISSGNDNIEYIYDASGRKLAKIYTQETPAVLTKTYYNANLVYTEESGINLDYILFEEGIISMESGIPDYNYFLKDHLGNTRVILSGQGKILQTHDYYPFGMEFTNQMAHLLVLWYVIHQYFKRDESQGNFYCSYFELLNFA